MDVLCARNEDGHQSGHRGSTLSACDDARQTTMSDDTEQTREEPQFVALGRDDPDMESAYRQASETLEDLKRHLEVGDDRLCSVKLRFRDPDEAGRLGEDRFVFMWLSDVRWLDDEDIFSAEFFELPKEFEKWHHVGERLGIEPEDIFDWMVIDAGKLYGGWTLRVGRERVPSGRRDEYDSYIGVSRYMQSTAPEEQADEPGRQPQRSSGPAVGKTGCRGTIP